MERRIPTAGAPVATTSVHQNMSQVATSRITATASPATATPATAGRDKCAVHRVKSTTEMNAHREKVSSVANAQAIRTPAFAPTAKTARLQGMGKSSGNPPAVTCHVQQRKTNNVLAKTPSGVASRKTFSAALGSKCSKA
jgi:mRNA-degrading endonuclease toxin of MazEF toxin-antitoxin module